jgi:hypothetical protein
MSDSSYITKLREAQTLVASRFVPRVINNVGTNNSFSLPDGFSITPAPGNTVDVNINGNLNVSGGIDPQFLQLVPQTNPIIPFNTSSQGKKGTLWVQSYLTDANRYTLRLDENIIYDTTNVHIANVINSSSFRSLKSNTLCVDYISSCNSNSTIIVNSDLVPSSHRVFSLGSQSKQWDTIWAKTININNNTINVFDDDGQKMCISYNVQKGTSFITTNDNITIETVTTSKNIPGQIDPSLLPFSGLSFASKINITEYKNNVGDSLVNLLLHGIYTLNKEVITSPFNQPTNNVEHNINKIIGQLNGNYYVVLNSNKNIEQIKLPKIKASTNFSASNTSALNITSPFTIQSEELLDITDGDVLIIYYSYIPNGSEFDIIFGFQNINFRLPINSVNNNNIIDNTITNNKLTNESISLRTLSNEVLSYINNNNNTNDNSQISSLVSLAKDLENKFNKVEKYIKLLSLTYFIKDTLTDTNITLDNINDIDYS